MTDLARIHEARIHEARIEAFAKLIKQYGEDPESYAEGVEEDPRPYLSGDEILPKFVCVTAHGERTLFLPLDDREVAQARATEYITDDTYAEVPVAVIDLDTGERLLPDWNSLLWHADPPKPEEPEEVEFILRRFDGTVLHTWKLPRYGGPFIWNPPLHDAPEGSLEWLTDGLVTARTREGWYGEWEVVS